MDEISWQESVQYTKYRWNNEGKKDLKLRVLFYSIAIPIVILAYMLFAGVGIFAFLVTSPILILLGLGEVFVWYGKNYGKRKITLNEQKIKAKSSFSAWECQLKHIENFESDDWSYDGYSGEKLSLKIYGGENVVFDLPDQEVAQKIFDLLPKQS